MRKFLSMLLALVMLLSMVPMASVAAGSETTWTKVASLADISESDTFAITITVGGNTYVLPVVQAGNASGSTAIPEITGTVSGNTLTISNTEYSFGWNLIPTTGGYHIKSGDLYLYVAASNNGIRIYKKNPDSTFVWNVLSCGLLGANEGASYRTLCVDATLATPQWGAYPTANKGTDGQANSKVRDNTLGLWKLNAASAHTCEDLDPKDHKCDTCGIALTACGDLDPVDHKCDVCGTALSSCVDINPKDHKCDICHTAVSTCSDKDGDGNHNCDTCNAENVTEHTDDPADGDHKCDECTDYQFGHVDTDEDKICDECKVALCGDDHLDTAGDGDHKCNRCGTDGVTTCADKSGDGDHKCDECGKENITECADSNTDKDHKCDECGKENMNSCSDSATDKDHNCDVCGKENITECTDSATDKDHDCDVCGKKDLNGHTWADATYENPKTCTVCGKTEGNPLTKPQAPEGAYWEKVDSLSAIGADDLLAITITIDNNTYILPNGYAANKASAPRADQLGTVTADGLYMTAPDGAKPSDYNWNVVAANGGYQIKAGENFLWMDANDVGLRITDTQSPSVWNVQSFGFLCASDPSGNERTLCIRDGLWKSFKVSGGNAHSTVRNNKLGLWKYVSNGTGGAPTPEPTPEFPYWKKVDSLAELNNNGQLAITVTEGGVTYVVPVNYVTDSKSKLGTGIHGTISDSGTYLTVDSAYGISQYSWTVSAAGDGYQIRSGNYFLWVDGSDTGLRVSENGNPSVWNTLSCGLLGAADPSGTYRILCFRNGAWNSIKTTGGTATGTAHSSVRGNTLGLWKYVTGEEDPNAHICGDAVGDGDHKCDECGNAGASLCYDKPNDKNHDCDECGKRNIGKCSDKSTDGDHKCDECGKKDITKCKDKDTDTDHRCDDCGAKDITPHIWMKPTYKNPQICIYCGMPLGKKLTEASKPEGSHWVKVESLDELGPDDRFAITIMIDGVPYVLPNAAVKSAKAAPNLSHKATISSDWEYITIGDGTNNASYNWSLEQVDGGYHIFAGDNYLWVTNSNSGIRISSTDTPTVWKLLHCKLLGGLDAEGDYRTICIRDDGWKSFKTAENSFWSKSHSTVRNNMLGLWKYVDLDPKGCNPCEDAPDDGDHVCDVCSKENVSECVDANMDHLCDDCSTNLTECNDTAEDGDHICDVCGKENFTDCSDVNGDSVCDDCGKALASKEEVEPENTKGNAVWYIIPVVILILAVLIVIFLKKKKAKE